MQFYLNNIQSIKEYTFDFPDTGLIQFTGENNNGKSVLIKVVTDVVLQRLGDDYVRKPLVSDWADNGVLGMSYKEKTLICYIDKKDKRKTYYAYQRSSTDKMYTRYVGDAGINEMLVDFGWCVLDTNRFCLQICETYGVIPFVNSTIQENYKIIAPVIEDTASTVFLNNYNNVSLPEAKKRVKVIKSEIAKLENELSIIKPKLYDIDKATILYNKSLEVLNKHEYLVKCSRINIEPPPNISINFSKVKPLIELPVFVELKKVKQLSAYYVDKAIVEMKDIKERRCPMCGKYLLDDDKSENHVCGRPTQVTKR